jgi:hypothetical protein
MKPPVKIDSISKVGHSCSIYISSESGLKQNNNDIKSTGCNM